MKTAYLKEMVRSLRHSPGRFIALMLIVGIGCGFFAGLRMSGIGMRKAADEYADSTHLFNLEVISEAGIGKNQVDALQDISGVTQAMPEISSDAVVQFDTERYGCRITTLPGSFSKDPEKPAVNELKLLEGRWPNAPNECVVLEARKDKIEASDTLTVVEEATPENPLLQEHEFTVVGSVEAPEYIYDVNLGPTNVGSGILQQIIFVQKDAFVQDAPYTAVQLTVDGGDKYFQDEESYKDRISEVTSEVDSKLEELSQKRGAELRAAYHAPAGSMADPAFYVLDRKQNYGVESYLEDSKRIDSIATVFPFIFFLVAALVALTTMTRMVESDRELIGTHKALGYTTSSLVARYLFYATLASIIGAILGIVVFSQLLPSVIFSAYGNAYDVPTRAFPLPIEADHASFALIFGCGITILATLLASLSVTKETPAALMHERAPKPGKRILLEHIKPLWKRLSFISKVTLRNIFRYKRRLCMTLIGIAGCSALILTGIGVRDSINDIIDKQFGNIFLYNTIIGLSDSATTEDISEVTTYIKAQDKVENASSLESLNVLMDLENNKTASVQLICPQDAESFQRVVTLKDRTSQNPIDFDTHSVVLTEKLASLLSVEPNDTITVYKTDATGNKTNESYTLTVTAITENYANSYLYLGKDVFTNTFGEAPKTNTFWLTCPTDDSFQDEFANHLQDMESVTTVIYNDETIEMYKSMLKSMDAVMVVLIGAAALLAFVVLYNLTNINISERKKEIATLKVLGFTRKEVTFYMYKEIILLVILGAFIGVIAGIFLEGFVIVTAEMDHLMFVRTLHFSAFVYAFLATLVFSCVILVLMLPKLHKINMVESLKAGE